MTGTNTQTAAGRAGLRRWPDRGAASLLEARSGSGIARSRASAARKAWAQGHARGRCSQSRRAERASLPAG